MQRIIVKNLKKDFEIGFKENQSALNVALRFLSGKEPKKVIRVLNGVNLEVAPGEILGIIGSNGSGKSTLLRTIAGIYPNYDGEVATDGKMVTLINLNVGLRGRLTMKENIFLISSLFGISRKDVHERLDSIIEFSGLREFADTKVYQFSSGMLARLSFSVAIHSDPKILLLDEVFEVGDESFREKSGKKIMEIVKNGGSIILVSHSLEMIKSRCDKTVWLDHGEVKKYGDTEGVIDAYLDYTKKIGVDLLKYNSI